jgi:hypothetical protein
VGHVASLPWHYNVVGFSVDGFNLYDACFFLQGCAFLDFGVAKIICVSFFAAGVFLF